MKKIFLLLLIIILSLSLLNGCSPANSPGFTPAEGEGEGEPTGDRVVLVELFNSDGCPNSILINPIAENLAQQYGTDQVILVEGAAWGRYTTSEVRERFDWYVPGAKHTPFIAFNGLSATFYAESIGSVGGGGGTTTPTPTTYTVTYNGNGSTGGTAPTDANHYLQGATVTVLGQGGLVKTGYTFDGWNTAANGTGTDRAAGSTFAMGTANVILYAQWTANPTYTVTYNGNGSTGGSVPVDASSPYLQGATVTVLTKGTLVKTGYTFDGWNTAANGSGTDRAAGSTFAMGTANVILYAQWEEEGFVPPSGLVLWLDAAGYDATSGVWTDKSTYNNTVSGGTHQPSKDGSVLNGLPVVQFNGSSQYLNLEWETTPTGNSMTIFLVQKSNDVSPSSASQTIFGYFSTSTDSNLPCIHISGSEDTSYGFFNSRGNRVYFGEKDDSHLETPYLMTLQYNNSASGTHTSWKNFVLGPTVGTYNNPRTGDSFSLAWDNTTIGRSSSTGSAYNWDGYIAEMMIFDSAVDVAAVQQYLIDKYGL